MTANSHNRAAQDAQRTRVVYATCKTGGGGVILCGRA